MEKFIREEHAHRIDRELLYMILENQFFIFQKHESFMSQTTGLLQQISDNVTGISTDIGGVAQEITDLKNQVAAGQDSADTIAKLTDLATRSSSAKAALDALVPAPAADTPPAETPAA